MALASALRVPVSHRIAFAGSVRAATPQFLWAGFLTLLIAAPWLSGGFLFGTDWPGPRRFDFPSEISSSAGLQVALALVSRLAGGEATGKLLVIGSLFSAALLAYRAAPAQSSLGRSFAAAVYVLNPFVYGRLHYGQVFLIAGYAVLPWVALRLHRVLEHPGVKTALLAALSFAVLGVLSIHLLFESVVLAGAATVAYFTWNWRRPALAARRVPALILAAGAALAASIYWIRPALAGQGYEGVTLAHIGSADLVSYAALPDAQLGLLPNLLGMYGFWAEGINRFTSMKDFVPLWPLVLMALLMVCAAGAVSSFKHRSDQISPWVLGLLLTAAAALIFEMGVSSPATAELARWLDAHVPLYRGMRDAGKWAALLALAYSQLGALGAETIRLWVGRRLTAAPSRSWIAGVTVGILIALPLFYGNGLLYGGHGEIQPSQYPDGWYAADRLLASDSHPGRTLFLPWHEYLGLSFVRNQNKVIASPAQTFFTTPTLTSANPEVPGLPLPTAPDQVAVSNLVQQGAAGDWPATLADLHVKYVLLARQVDWYTYTYLDAVPGLVRIQDFGSIVLYRNTLVL